MLPKNYIRLNAKPPGGKFPPPRNFIDFAYDPETGKIVAKDSAGDEVFFSADGSGEVFTSDLTTVTVSPSSGHLGELKTASSGSPVALSNNTAADLVTLALTPGVWDVRGAAHLNFTGTTLTLHEAAITPASITIVDGTTSGLQLTTTTTRNSLPINLIRAVIADVTVLYLSARATFSAGTVTGTGTIYATRVA